MSHLFLMYLSCWLMRSETWFRMSQEILVPRKQILLFSKCQNGSGRLLFISEKEPTLHCFLFSSPYICCILPSSRMSRPSDRDSNMRPTLSDAATLTAVRKMATSFAGRLNSQIFQGVVHTVYESYNWVSCGDYCCSTTTSWMLIIYFLCSIPNIFIVKF